MRERSKFACCLSVFAAAFGTRPASASVSVAASSTASHIRYLFSSLQMRPISGRVYRAIKGQLLKYSLELMIVNGIVAPQPQTFNPRATGTVRVIMSTALPDTVNDRKKTSRKRLLKLTEYRRLAEFRYQLRRFPR